MADYDVLNVARGANLAFASRARMAALQAMHLCNMRQHAAKTIARNCWQRGTALQYAGKNNLAMGASRHRLPPPAAQINES